MHRDSVQLRSCVLWVCALLLGVSPVLPGLFLTAVPAQPASPAGVRLQENLLSVDVRQQPLRTVIKGIATQGNIVVHHLEEVTNAPISIRFASVPLVEGLKRLLQAADLPGYVLVTDTQHGQTSVQRIVFLPSRAAGGDRARSASPSRRPSPAPRAAALRSGGRRTLSRSQQEAKRTQDDDDDDGSVFKEIKTNTTARRLLSQLVHPNEQVRERALERLVRLIDDDDKQAELLEFLEPLMDDLGSEERTVREEARTEIRKLLRR